MGKPIDLLPCCSIEADLGPKQLSRIGPRICNKANMHTMQTPIRTISLNSRRAGLTCSRSVHHGQTQCHKKGINPGQSLIVTVRALDFYQLSRLVDRGHWFPSEPFEVYQLVYYSIYIARHFFQISAPILLQKNLQVPSQKSPPPFPLAIRRGCYGGPPDRVLEASGGDNEKLWPLLIPTSGIEKIHFFCCVCLGQAQFLSVDFWVADQCSHWAFSRQKPLGRYRGECHIFLPQKLIMAELLATAVDRAEMLREKVSVDTLSYVMNQAKYVPHQSLERKRLLYFRTNFSILNAFL
eukprot:TRINITY_DN6674_c0_g1_i6.p1 TRINITY_DN6674_c0_g1~~TRINITY_DN6674_c0_g1_i6.p1  ORF type:complete len:295 (-),score=-30.57 TRINITY_DN6674_c0_g1_i6:132-1016(-)